MPSRPLILALLCLGLAWGAVGAQDTPSPLPVFVSIQPQKYFVEQVGGPYVRVQAMVGPGDSPATYAPTPRQLAALAQARVYFRIGVPFERVWMPRFQAINPRMLIVDTSEEIPLRRMKGHGGDHEHHGGLNDPHIWTSPPLVKIQARHIRDALIQLDPRHRDRYERNYRDFAQRLDALDSWIRARLRSAQGRRFMVFHPSWGYYADTYGLEQVPVEQEGKEPNARELGEIVDMMRRDHIRAIFVQPQFSRRLPQALATAAGARLVIADPLAEDYVENLKRVTEAFARALEDQ